MQLIKENMNKPISFIDLFKNLELVRSYNSIAGINQSVVVKFFDDPNDYGKDFYNYTTFKKFINEEYNNAKDILMAKFIIGEPFVIPFFGTDFTYIVDLTIE